MVDKKEIKTGKIDQMDRGEVEARLRSLIDKHGLDFDSKQEDWSLRTWRKMVRDGCGL